MNQKAFHYPWFKKEDTDAFFALFQNNLANFVIITITMLSMGFPTSIVFGQVIPGAAVAVLAGNLYYAYTANRLAKREQRLDVTALSYGISTPVMFIFLFGVLLPAITLTDDPQLAWKIGVSAAFISGLIEVIVSLIGRWIQRNLPRAAMLGAISGVALSFIAGEMLFMTMEIPVAGLLALAIIIVGVIGKVTMPFKIPASLFAIIIGTALAYTLGHASLDQITEGLAYVGFYPFLPTTAVFEGMTYLFGTMIALLAAVLPITIYNAVETMNNVEAMDAAGDKYDVRECQAVDGVGTMIGTLFGGLFPTTVYLATIGAKHMGAGRGYSILNAIVYTLTALFGLIAAISSIIPVAVIAPILVYVGVSMVATAFESNATKYYPAVVVAMLPYFSNYIMTRFNGDAGEVVADISAGIVPLGEGAMFTALIFGAITVFIIDGEFKKATVFSGIGAVFSFFGFMHAPELSFNASPEFALGYLMMGVFFFYQALKDVKIDRNQHLDQ
ncbi:AGZA family xanthine/uracil permease-like MFS transporter [Geomicrobium halophilum]|uniref:AGZA family xanthine/uracil permease-like MFS transporter n=1 Tax=Geomicrobium halophilum TaxID=549000 RepID=A0A841PWK3_9BACL|nr:NCS2 family permease [Geomicrobium halophilum]MBB6448235.1 AGZA family xanthine/uracil permease-like MFS transporter [Geomicrobium halophilum]